MRTPARQRQPRDKYLMRPRDMWMVGGIVVAIAVAVGLWQQSHGETSQIATYNAVSIVVIVAVALAANQIAARRRAKRRNATR